MEKNGEILTVSLDKINGTLRDESDGTIREFTNPAVLDVIVGSQVIFLLISTPKKDIAVIKDVRR